MITLRGKYNEAKVFTDNIEQEAISQIIGLCNHPAFQNASIRIMPDVHAGAGCTIGTTIRLTEKKIVPNLVGVDIGCGVLTTVFTVADTIDFKTLDSFIRANIPSGMSVRAGKSKKLKEEVKEAIRDVSKTINIGDHNYHLNSVGTLGGGNHYLEIGRINQNTYALSVHTGSRNLGKKVCEAFQLRAVSNLAGGIRLRKAIDELVVRLKNEHREKDINKEIMNLRNNFDGKITGIPKELAYIEGADYEAYIDSMIKCQKMASENRRIIASDIIEFLGVKVVEQFDTIHNYIEQSDDGTITIRKGAISAKGGEKLAIPLNMRDGVIIGVGKGNEDWNCSAPHGAGRLMSRSKAKELVALEEFKESMKDVWTSSVGQSTLDESPMAYKPMDEIIENIHDTVDIISIIKPLYNFKASE